MLTADPLATFNATFESAAKKLKNNEKNESNFPPHLEVEVLRKHIIKKEQWKFLVIFPKRSAEISVLLHRFQISRVLSNFSLTLQLQISDSISSHSDSTHFQNYASQVRDSFLIYFLFNLSSVLNF